MTQPTLQVEPLIVGPLDSNCYIIWNPETHEGAVIDPGDDAFLIINKIKHLKITIKYILATHGHFDHIGAVAPLKEHTKAQFLAHMEDEFFIKESTESANRWGITIPKPPLPDNYLKDGDTIKLGTITLEVFHTPGHSPGGISFHTDKMVFVGDTLFQRSIGRTDFRQGSFEQISHSIKNRLFKLPDETVVFTGHGPPTTIGEEKQNNPFVKI